MPCLESLSPRTFALHGWICAALTCQVQARMRPQGLNDSTRIATSLALKRAFQPGTKYVFKAFSGGKGLSLVRSLCTPWEALRNKNLRIQTCLRGWYQVRFFGLIFGHSWGSVEGPGLHLVRYLCETRKALHERHVWKTLTNSSLISEDLLLLALHEGQYW